MIGAVPIPARSVDLGPAASPAPSRRHRQLALVEDRARPIVKWSGGKGRLLSAISRLAPASHRTYLEPFAGGLAVFFHLSPERAILGDLNEDLIELYAEVSRDPVGLHRRIADMIGTHHRSSDRSGPYYEIRRAWNADRRAWSAQERAATFVYLNRACFNGLFRVNRSGEINTPVGKPPNSGSRQPWPGCPSLAMFVVASSALARAVVRCADYAEVLAGAGPGDFAYLDPPYLPRSRTGSFTAYTAGGFGPEDHDRLGGLARDLVDRGVMVMVSSSDVPGARDRYPGFDVHEVSSPSRSISASSSGRRRVPELILTCGYRAGVAA